MVIKLEKVLISDEVDAKCINLLQKKGIEVVKNTKLSKEELITEIPKYDGLIVRSATKVTADIINAGSNLKIIGRAGTGVDNIDTVAATNNGVIVMNTPGGNTLSAAEHTCTLIIALSRSLGAASLSMKEGKWDRKKFMGNELFGKTLAIIGLGRIGKEVALRMQSFGMTTIGFDPMVSPAESKEFNTEWLSLDEIWPKADYITVHTPLIPQTKNLLCDASFAKCKKGVKVVNCARGGIIEEAALLRALESGQCGGAGLDVFTEEPPKDYTLAKHPAVVATPHLGASTVEAQTRVAEDIAQQFIDLCEGKSLFGAINAPALANALSPSTQPWVQLGERLGVVGCLFTKNLSVTNTEVLLYGNELKSAGSFLTAALMAGFLKTTHMDTGDAPRRLNLINSPVLSKQAGLISSSTFTKDSDRTYIIVNFQGAGHEYLAMQGTVSGSEVKLMRVQNCNFHVPADLSGSVILYSLQTQTSLANIIAAATKDGASVQAVSTSEFKNNQGYGILNLSSPFTGSLVNLEAVVNKAYSVTL